MIASIRDPSAEKHTEEIDERSQEKTKGSNLGAVDAEGISQNNERPDSKHDEPTILMGPDSQISESDSHSITKYIPVVHHEKASEALRQTVIGLY